MLWTGKDYVSYMMYEKTDRPFFAELFGPLPQTAQEWRASGATEEELNMTAFCFDTINVASFSANGPVDGFMTGVLEETDEYIITRDILGRRNKLIKGSASIPLPLDYPVSDFDSWLRIKPMFEYCESRFDIPTLKAQKEKGYLINAWISGGFGMIRELMGDEVACLTYYDDPELMHDMISTLSDTAYEILDMVSAEVGIDQLCVHEDMAGKSGPLVGPSIIEEFITPYYRRQFDMLAERGTRLFSQDSDGNMEAVIDTFIDAGVNIFYPMEPASGMDIVKMRNKYGKKIAYKGGIDKHVLRTTKEAIEKELAYKLQPMMQEGGIVFGNDHRIPNGVSLENYKFYVDTAREMLGLEPVGKAEKGWNRMAF